MAETVATSLRPRKLAFLGLGVLGYPMAGHLARAGHTVTVYNRTASRASAWTAAHGGRAAATPRTAARDAELVFVCVGDDDDVRSVVNGDDGAFAGMASGAILVDHTTTSAILARELGTVARDRGLHFVDAPVSGGQSGAVNGTLTVMCGGEEPAVDQLREVAAAYARAVTRLGANGSGQLAKMVNQICIAGLLQALSEGLAFGEKAGLDMPLVLDVIAKGAAQSWQMENRGRTMLADQFDFGFAVRWMLKDLRITLEEARRNGADLPVTTLVETFYREIGTTGGAQWDTSSLIRRLR